MIVIWALILIFFLLASAFFSGIETGLISVNRIALKNLADEEDNKSARFILFILDNIEDILSVTLIGNNIALIAISVISSNKLLPFFEKNFGEVYGKLIMSGAVITPVVLLFAEIIPKDIFRQKSDKYVLKSVFLVKIAYYLFIIPGRIMMFFVKLFLPSFEKDGLLFSKDEIEHMISVSDKSGALEPGQKKMMEGIFDLSATIVKEIMTARVNIVALSMDSTVEDVIECVERNGYSRVPLYGESIDDIKGFVFVLDIIHDKDIDLKNCDLKKYLREVNFIPETKKIDDLFNEMKDNKEQIRMVVDEFGQISGLVTLEDIIEEIVGEIRDEYDEDVVEKIIKKEGAILIEALFSVEELNEKYGLELPLDDDYETVGGFIEHLTGEIPVEGQIIVWNGYKFQIKSMNNNSIGNILIKLPEKDEEGQGKDD